MVTDAIWEAIVTAIVWVIELFPDAPPEISDGIGGFASNVSSVIGSIAKLGPVIPFQQISLSAGIIFGMWIFAILVQSIRFALSAFTGGGGTV